MKPICKMTRSGQSLRFWENSIGAHKQQLCGHSGMIWVRQLGAEIDFDVAKHEEDPRLSSMQVYDVLQVRC